MGGRSGERGRVGGESKDRGESRGGRMPPHWFTLVVIHNGVFRKNNWP